MWKLTIEDDEAKQTSLPLAHEEYGLGRSDSNAIRLTDRNVSRAHALLKKNGQGWFLKDLQSYNGTYVNGARVVGEQLIGSGDVVQLGDYRLELIDETTTAGADAASGAAPAVAPIHQRPNRLVLVVGPTPGAEFPLDREHFTIGRSEEATISINHSSVSRVHAEVIAIGGGRFEIVDKGSANGIRINGVELRRGILEAGDALELGDVRLRFVGAGKIYKAFTDQTSQIHPAVAVPGFESVASVRAPAMGKGGGPSVGKLIGIGAAVGVAAIAVFVLMTRSGCGPSASTQPANAAQQGALPPPAGADGAAVLADAKALAAKKDFEGAHKRLKDLPEGSAARSDPTFKEVEGAWADALFAKVDTSADKEEKKKLLIQVTQALTVDGDRRKKAYGMLTEMGVEPPPIEAPVLPTPGPAPAPRTAAAPVEREPKPEAPTPPVVAPRKVDPGLAAATPEGISEDQKQERTYTNKCAAGKCSEGDLRMWKALCAHTGNRECRDRASAMLKKKAEGQ